MDAIKLIPALMAAGVLALLSACGTAPGGAPSVGSSDVESTSADAAPMVGSWQVEAAAGEEPGAVLGLAPGDLVLSRECGSFHGAWLARTGLFVGFVYGAPPHCEPAGVDWTPEWLRHAVGYRVVGENRELLDDGGNMVARLQPEATPTPRISQADDSVPAAGAPLPSGLEPATAAELLGRWVPTTGNNTADTTSPFLLIESAGEWQGSDGCNVLRGRWTLGLAGQMLVVSAPETAKWCPSVQFGGWLPRTSGAGFAGEELVLVDFDGGPVGRLVRDAH